MASYVFHFIYRRRVMNIMYCAICYAPANDASLSKKKRPRQQDDKARPRWQSLPYFNDMSAFNARYHRNECSAAGIIIGARENARMADDPMPRDGREEMVDGHARAAML